MSAGQVTQDRSTLSILDALPNQFSAKLFALYAKSSTSKSIINLFVSVTTPGVEQAALELEDCDMTLDAQHGIQPASPTAPNQHLCGPILVSLLSRPTFSLYTRLSLAIHW